MGRVAAGVPASWVFGAWASGQEGAQVGREGAREVRVTNGPVTHRSEKGTEDPRRVPRRIVLACHSSSPVRALFASR